MGNQVVAAFSGVPPKFSKRYISETKRSYDLKFSGFPFFNSIYVTVNWQGDLKGVRSDHSVSWHGMTLELFLEIWLLLAEMYCPKV